MNKVVDINFKVVLVSLPGKVRHINSTITFPRNKEGNILVLWELQIELKDCLQSIYGLRVVTMIEILCALTHRKANTSWLLKIQQICSFSPAMLVILVKVMSVSINEQWSVFLESSEERGAAGPTIEPNENWIRNISVLEIILGLDKHIMELLGISYL